MGLVHKFGQRYYQNKAMLRCNFGSVYILNQAKINILPYWTARQRSAVGNMSDYRCVSDCRFRSREFDPGPVPYFRGD